MQKFDKIHPYVVLMFDESILRNLVLKAEKDEIQKVVVGMVITNKNDEMLIVKRSETEAFLPGLCELPGGGVDEGEGLIGSLIREGKEETGLDIKSINSYVGYFDYKSRSGKDTRQFNFLVGANDGPVILNPDEHSEYYWIDAANINEFKRLKVTAIESIQNAYLELQKDKFGRDNFL